ncbi:neural proliferation differentiation and control protein 1-like [Gouania willdenowi]|uniref:Neural proliferation differentiation and control protein 1-like n=1 Tax=Gouania willdenowi TaxID=441366 RepID=A0A8C5G039_GOUWI|nr:neural proliferation differentiation and control protein 1-like [Gouania willdenowi]
MLSWSGHRSRASVLLLSAAVLLCAVPVSSSLPAHSRCPLNCGELRRHNCRLGSHSCGPCYSIYEEVDGDCVLTRRYSHGKGTSYNDFDAEIDLLHSYIEKQVSHVKAPRKQSQHPDSSINVQRDQGKLSNEARRTTTTEAPRHHSTALPSTPTPQPKVTGVDGRAGPISVPAFKKDKLLIILISMCVAVGCVAVILATVCYVKLQKESRLAEKVDYPAFKETPIPSVTSNGSSNGDKNLAQSAQMYHYQHQKQQMLSMGNPKAEQKVSDTDVTSDEEEVGGDFTVYECPGLAPTGEMEVKNPLFDDSAIPYQGNHK